MEKHLTSAEKQVVKDEEKAETAYQKTQKEGHPTLVKDAIGDTPTYPHPKDMQDSSLTNFKTEPLSAKLEEIRAAVKISGADSKQQQDLMDKIKDVLSR